MKVAAPSPQIRKIFAGCLALIAVGACVALWRDTFYNGWDFGVYWRAAHAWREGRSPYLEGAGSIWVFKYPPWTLFLFWPFSFLDEAGARAVWGGVEIVSLVGIVAWMKRSFQVSQLSWLLVTAFFWFLIAYHALAGQLVLPMTALGLWAWTWADQAPLGSGSRAVREAILLGIWSLKTTSAWTWLGRALRNRKDRVTALFLFGAAALLSTGLLASSLGQGTDFQLLIRQWSLTMMSGTDATAGDGFLGWRNQSLAAFLARIAKLMGHPIALTGVEFLFLTAVVAVFLLFFGVWTTRKLKSVESAVIWIALGAVVQPLAWFHGFVQAWPLAVLTLHRCFESKRNRILSVVGLAFLTVVSGSSLGWVGDAALLFSVKSWGVLILCGVLGRITRDRYTELT